MATRISDNMDSNQEDAMQQSYTCFYCHSILPYEVCVSGTHFCLQATNAIEFWGNVVKIASANSTEDQDEHGDSESTHEPSHDSVPRAIYKVQDEDGNTVELHPDIEDNVEITVFPDEMECEDSLTEDSKSAVIKGMDESLDSQDGESDSGKHNNWRLKMISLVKQRPPLYDKRLPLTDRTFPIRAKLWKQVYDGLNGLVPIDLLPKRFKVLRDRYNKEVKRRKLGHPPRKPWSLFKHLEFLSHSKKKINNTGMKKKSSVWNHFTKKEGKKYECNYCKTVVSTAGGSTGNLSRHLRKKSHPPLPIGIEVNSKTSHGMSASPLTQFTSSSEPTKSTEIIVESNTSGRRLDSPTSSISEMEADDDIITVSHVEFESSTSTSAVSKFKYLSTESSPKNFFKVTEHVDFQKSNDLDLQLLKMICKEYHPFNLVEVTEFKKFASLLCPGYRLPSRRTLCRSLLPKMYKELVVKLKEQLRKSTAVALTADSWIAANKQNCIAITAHYIDENTTLSASLLGCVKLNEKHTANNFSETLIKICKDWDVDDKIIAVVTENTENSLAGIKQCQWRHISCYAHSINSVVNAGLKPVHHIIEKIKNVVEFYKKSPDAVATLYSTRKQLELPELKLKLPDVTKWNSIYDMLIRVVFNKTPIIVTWTVLQNEEFSVSADEWVVCDHVIKLLAIFEEVTKEISSEKSVSLSKTVILTRTLLDYVVCYRRSHILPYVVIEMCNILVMKINENLVEAGANNLKYQAAFLDPRFKKTAFKNDADKYKEVYEALASHIQSSVNSEPHLSPAIPLSTSSCSTPKLWSVFDNKVAILTSLRDPRATGVTELDKYLAEPILPRTCDPLVWWHQRKLVYPNLYRITLKRLCIPASSTPCEFIFSKAGQILTGRRNRLSSSNLSHVMFLNSNL